MLFWVVSVPSIVLRRLRSKSLPTLRLHPLKLLGIGAGDRGCLPNPALTCAAGRVRGSFLVSANQCLPEGTESKLVHLTEHRALAAQPQPVGQPMSGRQKCAALGEEEGKQGTH